jgi:hypothetical protein
MRESLERTKIWSSALMGHGRKNDCAGLDWHIVVLSELLL